MGVKLVRGAYHNLENTSHSESALGRPSSSISSESTPPVWQSKAETDKCFDDCAHLLVKQVASDFRKGASSSVGVLFGTHNRESCELVLDALEEEGAAVRLGKEKTVFQISQGVSSRVAVAQLYGKFIYISFICLKC